MFSVRPKADLVGLLHTLNGRIVRPLERGGLLEFADCKTGKVTFDLGSGNASGVIQIQLLANDGVALCEVQYRGPAKPGPL